MKEYLLMKIVEEHAEANVVAGGGVSYAEVKVVENFAGCKTAPKEYYVIYTLGEGESFGVSEMSINDPRITEGGELLNYIEQYNSLSDATKSRFGEYFIIAERMMNEIG